MTLAAQLDDVARHFWTRIMTLTNGIDRFLRINEVLRTTGLAKNTIYRRIREGTFPRQIRIGPNSVAWRQSEIEKWMFNPIRVD
jgi:prophage regulatory protein